MAATGSIWFLIAVFGVVSAVGQSGTSLTNTGAMLSKWFRRRRGPPQAGIGLARQLAAAVIGPAQAKLRPAASGDTVDTPRLVAHSNVIRE